jgi:AcrR family transcriptional regulator
MPMRADARRNSELLISTAREVFAEKGPDAPLDDIVRRAGVGAGTLYRHFPSRESLMAAVYQDDLTRLSAYADELLATHPPGEALDLWMREQVAYVRFKRGLVVALKALVAKDSVAMDECRIIMRAAADRLLVAARATHEIRTDVTAADLLRVGHAIGTLSEHATAEEVDRVLSVMLDGLRVRT